MKPVHQKFESVPQFLFPLFWEYEPESIKLREHAHLVMARVMEWGDWRAMSWLGTAFSKQELVSFLRGRGRSILPPRELNYWALITGVSNEERQKWIAEARDRNRDQSS
jgi:hypothetical protein